jgi:hypothetical protein
VGVQKKDQERKKKNNVHTKHWRMDKKEKEKVKKGLDRRTKTKSILGIKKNRLEETLRSLR